MRKALGPRPVIGIFLVLAIVLTAQILWWTFFLIYDAREDSALALQRVQMDGEHARLFLETEYRRYLEAVGRTPLETLDDPALDPALMEGLNRGLVNRIDLYALGTDDRMAPLGSQTLPGAPGPEIPRTSVPEDQADFAIGHAGALLICRAAAGGQRLLVARIDPSFTARTLEERFPGLEYRPAEIDPHLTVFPGPGVLPWSNLYTSPSTLHRIASIRRRRVTMFVSEGSVLFLLSIAGVLLIYRALREEERLKRLQSNFTSAVTHELRSPLASLRLLLQTIAMGRTDPPQTQKFVQDMLGQVDRLETLVGNVLATGRRDARAVTLHPVAMDLGHAAGRVLDGLAATFEGREPVRRDLPADVVVRVDPAALESILRNLLENAAKYSEPQAPIAVRVRKEGRTGILEVEDRGVGIPRKEQERIFDRFYRVGDEMVRARPGAGLGLYLVRELARDHGGDVLVRSDGAGKGSVFTVRLPLAEGPHP